MTKVLISCGEASGDMYAAALTSELVRLDPGAQVFGLGGDRMTAAGARLIGHYHGLSVTGLVEALAVLPRALAMYRRLVDAMRRDRPDVLVAVDFPDFNFRLASAGRRLGLPVVYYVGPQVWAWRRGRLRTLKRFVDRMLVIFPFEEAVYRDAGIPVEFVGHPLVDLAEAKTPRATLLAECGLKLAAPTVALLPGSRPNEVEQLLPILVEAARMIVAGVPEAQFIIARAPNLDESLFSPLAHWRGPRRPAVIEARTDDVLSAVDVVATASGTATIQAAIHGRPMVIISTHSSHSPKVSSAIRPSAPSILSSSLRSRSRMRRSRLASLSQLARSEGSAKVASLSFISLTVRPASSINCRRCDWRSFSNIPICSLLK